MSNTFNRFGIILEGTDCVGKTTVFRALQDKIPLHMALKLSAAPKPFMTPQYMVDVHSAALEFLSKACYNHFLLDRYTISERVYGGLYRGLTFGDLHYLKEVEAGAEALGAHLFVLVADEKELARRLDAKRLESPNENHGELEDIIRVQHGYVRLVREFGNELGFSESHVHLLDVTELCPDRTSDAILRLVNASLHTGSIHDA